MRGRGRLGWWVCLALALGCDKFGAGAGEAGGGEPAPEAESPAAEPTQDSPTPSTEPQPSDAAAPPTGPTVIPDPPTANPGAAKSLASLAAAVERSDDPSAEAWAHYNAKRYAEAVPYFAQAALAEPEPWKHPFNLACAAARAGDEEAARLGLAEAVARDREATAAKARRDPDLGSLRTQPWFEDTLSGAAGAEPSPAAPPPAGSGTPLTAAQLAQLRAKLGAKHGVDLQLGASLAVPGPAGETLGFAIYSITKLDECAASKPRAQCNEQLRAEYEEDYDQTRCNSERLIRASFGPELLLDEPVPLEVPCKLVKLRRFEAVDLDADGELELIVDATGRQTATGMEESEIINSGRHVRIVRLDGSSQFELKFAWEIMDIAPGDGQAQRFSLTDQDRDGHPDLRIETMQFVGDSALGFDDELWPTGELDEDEPALGPLESELRHYDPSKDEWVRRP